MSVLLFFLIMLAFFILQFVILLTAKKMAVRLIPLYLLLVMLFFSSVTFFGLFAQGPANELLGLLFFLLSGAEALGAILAWLCFFFVRWLQRRDSAFSGKAGGED